MGRLCETPRAAVLGQGSIGRRHASLLVAAGCDVVVFDPVQIPGRSGVRWASTRKEALSGADVAVVASPTSCHLDDALAAVRAGCHVLVEKPLAVSPRNVEPVLEEAARAGRVFAVAMNLRFHPGPAEVRRAVAGGEIGKPLLAMVSFGSYLPDWRPGTDYRQAYSARSELGGGVLLDVVHELDYATWILGSVTEVSAWLERISALELDVEDVALLHLRHASGAVASVALDYLDRVYRRGCRIVGSEGSIEWSWTEERVVLHWSGSESVRKTPSSVDPAYRDQLTAFLAAARSGTLESSSLVGGSEALAALRVIEAARISSAERRCARPEGANGDRSGQDTQR